MSRADRLGNDPNWPHPSTACDDGGDHRWQPVSFVFESQLLDKEGRVLIRQPDLEAGRVYVVCMECRSHTYIPTEWAGFRLFGPGETDEEDEADSGLSPEVGERSGEGET